MIYKENNPILQGASGSLDDITFRNVNGQLVAMKKPGPRKKPASAPQLKNEARFSCAAAHAVTALKNPRVYAYFKALGKKRFRTAYIMALRFYLAEIKAGRVEVGPLVHGVAVNYSITCSQSSSSILTLAVTNGLSVTSTWEKPYWV